VVGQQIFVLIVHSKVATNSGLECVVVRTNVPGLWFIVPSGQLLLIGTVITIFRKPLFSSYSSPSSPPAPMAAFNDTL